jgi:hypothetical protein
LKETKCLTQFHGRSMCEPKLRSLFLRLRWKRRLFLQLRWIFLRLNGGGYAPFLWRTGFSIPQLRWISHCPATQASGGSSQKRCSPTCLGKRNSVVAGIRCCGRVSGGFYQVEVQLIFRPTSSARCLCRQRMVAHLRGGWGDEPRRQAQPLSQPRMIAASAAAAG